MTNRVLTNEQITTRAKGEKRELSLNQLINQKSI